jgi:hypothetical protein
MEWIRSKKERVAACGWCTYAALVSMQSDDALDLKEVESLLDLILKEIDGVQNRVRFTMNGFVIAVGSYVKPLQGRARQTADQLGTVKVEMGDTACKVPVASAYIDKVLASSKGGQKRKTVRC